MRRDHECVLTLNLAIICSTYFYRGVRSIARQLLATIRIRECCYREDCQPLRLSVVCASSRDGQVLIRPTLIILSPFSFFLLTSSSFPFLLLSTIFYSSFPQFGHMSAFPNNLFSSSQVIFTETSPRCASFIKVMSLVY